MGKYKIGFDSFMDRLGINCQFLMLCTIIKDEMSKWTIINEKLDMREFTHIFPFNLGKFFLEARNFVMMMIINSDFLC